MKIDFGENKSGFGPGVLIELDGDDVAHAIDLYLYARFINVQGPRTIRVNGLGCDKVRASCYVDPSGFVMLPSGKRMDGRGQIIP